VSHVRRWWPWLVGAVILIVVATRIPVDAFRDAIEHGPHVRLGLVTLALTCGILCTDSFTVWIGLRALGVRRPKRHVFAIRGATYLLVIVNYALGQGAFGLYLNRSGMPGLRAAGATLFLVGTNLAMLMLATLAVWTFGSSAPAHDALWWTLVLGCSGFAAYLAIVAIAPRFLSKNPLLAPLFDAGVRGHVIALIGRLPHTVMMVLAPWIAIRVWGIPVPPVAGLTLMPIVAIATVLPIAPAGLGTAQVALVYFFGHWATDAKVLAFSIVYFAYGLLASAALGFVAMSVARRFGILDAPGQREVASSVGNSPILFANGVTEPLVARRSARTSTPRTTPRADQP
jgi:hypothetical protein